MSFPKSVPALERALDVLELIAKNNTLSFGETVSSLDYPRASLARILKTLAEREYLDKDGQANYRIGSAIGRLLPSCTTAERLKLVADEAVKQLRNSTQETAILFHWDGQVLHCLAKETTETSIVMQQIDETRVDIFNYPWSAFVYQQLKQEGRLRLVQDVSNELAEEMEQRLKAFERDGFVRVVDGSCRVTAPIYGSNGDLVGAVAVGAHQLTPDKASTEYGYLVATAAKQIEDKFRA